MTSPSPDMLISAYLDDCITASQLETLSQWIKASPDHADQFARRCIMHYSIHACLELEDRQRFSREQLDDDAQQKVALLAEVIDRERQARQREQREHAAAKERKKAEAREAAERWQRMLAMTTGYSPADNKPATRRIVIPKPLFYSGLAAMIAVVITLAINFWPERTQPQPIAEEETPPQVAHVEPEPPAAQPETPDTRPEPRPIIATIGRTIAADWDQTVALESDMRLRQGSRFTLTEGFIEVIMQRGARVVLEAPCVVELIDDNRLRLDRGRLVARAPQGVSRFTVDTPTAQYIDLGTEFGVEVHEDGSSSMAVLEGIVRVIEGPPDKERDYRASYEIYDNWGAIVGTDGMVSEVPALEGSDSMIRFVRQIPGPESWATGILAKTGTVQTLQPSGERIDLENLVDRQTTFIIREATVVLNEDLPVALTTSGRADRHGQETEHIPAGTRVTSYLLHFMPSTEPHDTMNSGTIRFAGQVVGVITNSQRLMDTDALFGIPEMSYANLQPHSRGLEDIQDMISVKSNSRLVSFDFSARSSSDQARILINNPQVSDAHGVKEASPPRSLEGMNDKK